MKDRKKDNRTGTRVQMYKKKLTFLMHAFVIAILVTVIGVSGFFLYSMLNPSSEETLINPSSQFTLDNSNSQLKAAIVDQLSLTYPNQTFTQAAATILNQGGYTVDYYSGEKVTVEFYRNLPTHSYSLIIFRCHSAVRGAFFTSDPYSTSADSRAQLMGYVRPVSYVKGGSVYFAISPSFITSYAKGTFNGSIIITMGCYGSQLNNMEEDMAEAFIESGAKAYIGWSGPVLAEHTDSAVTCLLKHLFIERQEIEKAVGQTMEEVGSDPTYKSMLLALPDEQHTIESTQSIENDDRNYHRRGLRPSPD